MTSRPHSMVLISFFPCIFPLLASPSQHGSLLHFSHTPFTLPPIKHKSKNHLLGLFTSFSLTQQFNIGQVIIDVMTPYHDPSYRGGDFPFASSFPLSWRTLALNQTQPQGFKLPMPTWMGAYGPSITTTSIDPWHTQLTMTLRKQHNRQHMKHQQRRMSSMLWSKMQSQRQIFLSFLLTLASIKVMRVLHELLMMHLLLPTRLPKKL